MPQGHGRPTRQDLQPLAEINMEALKEYHFFTSVIADGPPAALGEAKWSVTEVGSVST